MQVIDITTFRLADGVDERAFVDADTRVQTEFIPNHPGFIRRTTAHGDDGEWVVITLWGSEADADASAALAVSHPVMTAFNALIESVESKRYRPLD